MDSVLHNRYPRLCTVLYTLRCTSCMAPCLELTDVMQALHYAKERGALCIGVTNTVGSAIARHTDCGVHINAGCEIGVASTKAYTAQMVVITMMALALSEDSIAKRPKRDAVIDALGTLPSKLRRVKSTSLLLLQAVAALVIDTIHAAAVPCPSAAFSGFVDNILVLMSIVQMSRCPSESSSFL